MSKFRSCPSCRGRGKLEITVGCPECEGKGTIDAPQLVAKLGDLLSDDVLDMIARMVDEAEEAERGKFR